jgi:predicted  nucleic acid-binding Zn-ribbon protein
MTANIENLILEQLRQIRAEIRDVRAVVLQNVEYTRRLEQRMGSFEQRLNHLRDDLELMIKAELMGRLGHFETAIEQRLDALGDRIAHLDVRS